MNYIENIYVCLAAPLLIALVCARERGRAMLFFILSGMSACLLSSYISTFLTFLYQMDFITASISIVPIVEESMKLLPNLFYLLVFEPEKEKIPPGVFMTACGFATLENVRYLVQNGSSSFINLLIRGFGTGAMHVICGIIIFIGLISLWDRVSLRAAGTVGLLAAAITYHGIYNMLVLQTGRIALIAYLIPVCSALVYKLLFISGQKI